MLSGAKEDGIYLVAKNLLLLGTTVDVVCNATGLSKKEVEEIEKEIKHN
jgi:hypothetical protein